MLYDNILKMIGNTPVVRINKLNPYKDVEIIAKLEGTNPGGSVKDRIALEMIEEAEKSGILDSSKTIIEPTSGNTGIGLAMVAAVKGYDIEIVMSKAVSIERRKVLEGLGARIILSPAKEGTDGAIRLCKEISQRSPQKYFFPNQFSNKNNYLAHYRHTAEEIIEQVPEITHLVAGIGTSGTLMGCSRRLKEHNKDTKIIACEPIMHHKIQGLKSLEESEVPQIYDESFIDEKIIITDQEAFQMTRRLANEEGLFVGMSSGAALAGALRIARGLRKGKIVVIFPDRGEKYLSTPLFKKKYMSLRLYNTLSRSVEDFVPLIKNSVSMYSCGPTVYNYAHIGNFRSYLFADLLKRYLKYRGYKVTHVMNITDVDDKTIKNSMAEGKSLKDYSEFFTEEFLKDLDTLNIQKPDIIPHATETIDEIVELIKTLLDKGFAYKSNDGSIYFDIKRFKEYGKLSNTRLDNLKSTGRVKNDEYEKGNIADFALWKAWDKEDGDVFWETDIGKGRPGWHIECSAMSQKYLGENFDIHTGGVDLIFPHHENEIAQSEAATGKRFVNYWLHCEHLIVDGKKMSKSLGNFYTLRDLLDRGYKPMAIRYALISTHYKQQLNFTFQGVEAAQKSVERLNEFIRTLRNIKGKQKKSEGISKLIAEVKKGFEDSMDDNLNISSALADIFDFIRKVNRLISEDRVGKDDAGDILDAMKKLDSVLGVMNHQDDKVDKDVLELIEKREEARKKKDWKTADSIRDELKKRGIFLEDTKEGVQWKRL